MKQLYLLCFTTAIFSVSCNGPFNKTIDGNGNITTENRSINDAHKIECRGHFDVELTQGSSTSLKITGDENLLPYIVTSNENGKLVIKTKDNINLHSDNKIKIFITTDRLEKFGLAGSGDVAGTNKFTSNNEMEFSLAGTGNIKFEVNCPGVKSGIAGSGDIFLAGETKNAEINIAGSGNYHAQDLKTEITKVDIAGTGDATLFADKELNINIAGVGNIYYTGNPTVNQKIAGSGKIKKMD